MNKIQIPWEDRPVGCTDVMWRYSQNPVIGRYHIPSSNSIFNSAVVPFEDGFAGVFRCDNKAVQMNIFAGFSKDGIHWDINHEPIQFGVMAIMALRLVLPILLTLRSFSSAKMLSCLSIVMVYFSRRRSMASMRC